MTHTFALEGIRVIDFGQYIAGPMAAMMLADYGADVIRVDPPSGPCFNTPANATWNRGKRSIALDLKKTPDLKIAHQLVATADVVIENFRPGVMNRLGLGPAAMTALNARLVYCSLPGFASDDPRSGVKAWEGVIGAAAACYSTHPLANLDHPVYNCLPFSSLYGAFSAAVAIAMALNARERSGLGQIIEAPLFGATFSAFSGKAVKVLSKPEVEPRSSWGRAYCKDGRWLIYVPKNTHATILKEFDLPSQPDATHSAEFLSKRIAEIFLTRTSREWEEFCASKNIEGTACYTSAEWMQHPLARSSRIIEEFDDPELGKFLGTGLCGRLSDTPGAVRSPRPKLDEHRSEILREIHTRKPQPALSGETTLRSALEGIKVLDLGIILAIPSCGRTLAEFGADVVKIDSPHRNPVNWHNDVNRGKRSMLLDLKTEEGLGIFWRLLEDADVVLENFRTGVADKLGIGYAAVRARRPSIIYGSVNAFGQAEDYATRPGREVLIQALTGMQVRYGGEKPAQNPFNASDYATGLIVSYAIALALLHRRRTGQGQHINSALIYAATMLQSSLMQDYKGKTWDEPSGQNARGGGPLYRAYEASDGWIFFAAQSHDLKRCPALSDLAGKAGAELERTLEERFKGRTVETWVSLLTEADIGAHRVARQFSELMEDPLVIEQGLSVTRPHDELGLVTTTGPALRLSRTPLTIGRPAPKPGSDAASILAEIQMDGELERLITQRIIVVDGIKPGGAS